MAITKTMGKSFISFIAKKVALNVVVPLKHSISSLLIKITSNDTRIYQMNYFQYTI